MDEREDAPLREHREGDEQEKRREHVHDLHGQGKSDPRSGRASQLQHEVDEETDGAERKAVVRNSGARRSRSFASSGLMSARPEPARKSLQKSAEERDGQRRPVSRLRHAPGQEQGDADGGIDQELQGRWPIP